MIPQDVQALCGATWVAQREGRAKDAQAMMQQVTSLGEHCGDSGRRCERAGRNGRIPARQNHSMTRQTLPTRSVRRLFFACSVSIHSSMRASSSRQRQRAIVEQCVVKAADVEPVAERCLRLRA